MKDKITREAYRDDEGKVFFITKKVSDKSTEHRMITVTEEVLSQVTNEILDEYEVDQKEQDKGFKKQEKDCLKKINTIQRDLKKHSGERGYKQYKKNFETYEMYENLIEQNVDVNKLLSGEVLKEFDKYKKNRDKYKNFYVNVTQERELETLNNNMDAFKDIWEESKMLKKQIKEGRRLLK